MRELWKHQKLGVQKALDQDEFAFLFDMGTGKTATAIHAFRHRCQREGRLLKCLILSPKAVLTNWKAEFKKHSKIDQKEIIVLDQSSTKAKTKKFRDAVEDPGTHQLSKAKIVVTNYDAFKKGSPFVAALDEWGIEVLICDESHKLKSHESKRAKEIIKLADKIRYKNILTGTPILNTPMDIFNQYRVLDGGKTFGKNYWAFRSQWFQDENAGFQGRAHYFPKFTPRPSTFAEFNKLIYAKGMRVLKSECLDLPPLTRQVAYVDLGQEQAKMYRDMKETYIAYVEGLEKSGEPRAVIAQLAITKALRLQQIVSGHAKLDNGDIYVIKENPRLDVLREYIEELAPNNKIIIWATFHENYRAINEVCRKLKIGYREYHGLVPHQERDINLKDFRANDEVRVMIANQNAGGVGINMIEASYSIFYSRNFSLEQDLQAEARNHRGGSEIHSKITRIDLIAKNTIDELISDALSLKQSIATKILEWKDKL